MVTLDNALDTAMNLPFSERIRLVEILTKRIIQERRLEIVKEVKESSELYDAGKLESLSADEAINLLHTILKEIDNYE
jgi:hypothetical protein